MAERMKMTAGHVRGIDVSASALNYTLGRVQPEEISTRDVQVPVISGMDRIETRKESRVHTLLKNLGRKRRPGGGRKMLTPDQRKIPTFRYNREEAWDWVLTNAAWIHKVFVMVVNEKVIKQYTVSYRGKPFTDRFRWNTPKGAKYLGRPVGDVLDYLMSEALEAAAVGYDKFDPKKPTKANGTDDERCRRFVAQLISHAVTDEAKRLATADGAVKELVPLRVLHNEPVPEEQDVIVTADKAALVLQAIGSLSPSEQKALELYAEGHTYANIATLCKLTDRGHALKVVRRAKAKAARAILADDGEVV